MEPEFCRTELLIGKQDLDKLAASTVAVFGIGGVGSFAVEGLVRSGIGKLVLIDNDVVCPSNINRQLHATIKTIGRPKVEVMKERILEINPSAKVETYQQFYRPESGWKLLSKDYDYIVDAIDTVTAKIDLIIKAQEIGIPIISCLGAGNKLDPTRFEIADIYQTSVCPLARVMRSELRKRGVQKLKVVYSQEPPLTPGVNKDTNCQENYSCGEAAISGSRRQTPGSIAFVPSVAGLIIASEVIKDLRSYK
jgi:tRNA A37 threonylcarbamoyladenosine dehydratase